MTRTEAEHLLDAYKLMVDLYGDEEEAAKALREFILDAMASTTSYPYVTVTNPKPWQYPQVTCTTATGEVDA